MKFLDTDFSLKYIVAEIDGKKISISFYDTFWKGIHDVSLYTDGKKEDIKIESTYPGFVRKIQEAILLVSLELEYLVNRITKRNC